MRVSEGQPRTSDGALRLAAARSALVQAEQRAGLRDGGARQVQSAMTQALEGSPERSSVRFPSSLGATALATLSAAQDLPAAGEQEDPWTSVRGDASGALSVTGSTTVLLAAAARRQGDHGWCGVIGGDDIGWCAAAEVGLDLSRVLLVPAPHLAPSEVLAATSALLDGVDVLVVEAEPALRLRARERRTLLARARKRGVLLLSDLPWEGGRVLEAEPVSEAVLPGPDREVPGGYLSDLTWTLRDPARPLSQSHLRLGADGLRVLQPQRFRVRAPARDAVRVRDAVPVLSLVRGA